MTEIEYVLDKVNSEINVVEQVVAGGAAKDYAEYQHLCGKIRGLLEAKAIILALIERMEKDDD